MPSFDVCSEVNWQNIDDAINQTLKEVNGRFDFKGVKTEMDLDKKTKLLKMTCSEAYKMEALQDVFHKKLAKRGVSVFSINYPDSTTQGSGSSGRINAEIVSGISKDKAKEVVAEIKNSKLKVQAQIQEEKVRVTGKNRDDLQDVIALLRDVQAKLKIALTFENFRD